MNKGLSLVELLLSMTIASILVLALLSMNTLGAKTYREARDSWYCMQSLRNAVVLLDTDLMQCGYLLPQDLRIIPGHDQLFIAGTAITSSHNGLRLPKTLPPPLFSVVRAANDYSIVLDTIDIDNSTSPDYWADIGIISDSGGFVISHTYSRGNTLIPLTGKAAVTVGQRVVPAIHYELKSDGLYRNNQLIAEAIQVFDTTKDGNAVRISIQAGYNGISKEISYLYAFR
ncbi:MAG: prepilin-type N-terminal cleavage/methylation domain-containing protein [Deltaproteobacteria bacterium]|nr:prepilin-type N-terminal cleavage/methylation domain-containing protein [Deltaproteobacteria bacterium]